MMNISSKRGFTLVEVMVFSVVSLMFIGLLAQVFIMATRRTEDSRLRVDVQQSAVMIMKIFERDLEKVSSRSLTASDSELYVLAMTPVNSWTAAPSVQWKQEQYLWVHDKVTKTLHREIQNPGESGYEFAETLTFSRPYIPLSAELQTVGATPNGRERNLSPYVEEFSLSDRNGSKTAFQTQPLKLEMKLRRPLSSSERIAEFTISRWYTLRNSF